MALFTGQRGTEDTAPDPSSGAPGTDGYRRLNRRCMISIYINYGIWYAILLAICAFLTTFSQNLSDPYYEIARLALLGVPAAVLVYVWWPRRSFTHDTATGSPTTGSKCVAAFW